MFEEYRQRFLSYLREDPETHCLNWTKSIRPDGYGQFRMPGTTMKANRAAWTLFRGPITPSECVLHKCDNRACCNPDHLFLGDRPTNSADMVAKGRSARGERHHWAKLKSEQVTAIRSEHAAGGISMRGLGRKYGVTHENIRAILYNRTWT